MSYSEKDIRHIVRDELRKIFATNDLEVEILPIHKAAPRLGYDSTKALRELVLKYSKVAV